MPKNKGKYHSKVEKEVIPPEKEIVTFTQKAYEYVRPHAVKIGAVLGGVAVVLIGFTVWTWHVQKREGNATRAFGQAMEILRAPLVKPDEPPDPNRASDEPTFPSARERTEAALAKLSKLDQEYSSAAAANQARLVKASLLYDLGRYDESIDAYRKFIAKAPDGYLEKVAMEGIGYAQEARALAQTDANQRTAGLKEALATFVKLQPDEKGYYRDFALYHQARLQATLGDRAAALAIYKQILEKFPATSLRWEVTNRMAQLEEQG